MRKYKKKHNKEISCFYLLKHDPYFKHLSFENKKFHHTIYRKFKKNINQKVIRWFIEEIHSARENYCLIQEIKRVARGEQYYDEEYSIYKVYSRGACKI